MAGTLDPNSLMASGTAWVGVSAPSPKTQGSENLRPPLEDLGKPLGA